MSWRGPFVLLTVRLRRYFLFVALAADLGGLPGPRRFLFFEPGGRPGPRRIRVFAPGGRPGPRRPRRHLLRRPFLAFFLLVPPTAPSSPWMASCTCSRTMSRITVTKLRRRGIDPPWHRSLALDLNAVRSVWRVSA